MIKIEVSSDKVHDRVVRRKSDGREFAMREQDAYAYTVDRNGQPDKHPTKIVLNLERDQPGYATGFYTILPESLYVGKFGQLEIGKLKLKALAANTSKQASA
jgi:hypothetical protein